MVGVGVHVEQRRAARVGERVEHVAIAPLRHVGDALEHRQSALRRRPVASAPMQLGLALPQYDYSVAGRVAAAVRDDRRARARGPSALGLRLALAVRPPLPRHREVRRAAPTRYGAFEPHRRRSARSPRVVDAAAPRHARAVRGAAAGVRAREGARHARPHQRRSPRRRARRGLVRARLRRRSAWRCRARASASRACAEARRRRHRAPRRRAVHATTGAYHRARRRGRTFRPRCSSRARRVFVGGKGDRLLALVAEHADGWNTCWAWTPDAYRERLEVLDARVRRGRPRSGDGLALARPLRARRRGRAPTSSAGSSACRDLAARRARRRRRSTSGAPGGSSARSSRCASRSACGRRSASRP